MMLDGRVYHALLEENSATGQLAGMCPFETDMQRPGRPYISVVNWIRKAGKNEMDDRKKIEECYRLMYEGMVNKDEELLQKVLDPSFDLMHMTGMRQLKAEFIQAVLDGTLNYSSARHQHIDVNIKGNEAELTGQSLVHAAVFGGGWHTWRLQLRCRLKETDGVWLITEARASTY